MYTEVNNYSVYDLNFTFPIEAGTNIVNIDCNSLGGDGTVYLDNDISQGLGCLGTGTTVQETFIVTEPSNLILEDYINLTNVSFGTITIELQEEVNTGEHIFNSKEDMKQFYILELAICLIIIVFIFLHKVVKTLKF